MSITRINEFRAQEGSGDLLHQLIKSTVPVIEASAGCQSCQVLRSQKDRNHIIVLEVWESIDAHQASLKTISPDVFHEVKKLLAAPPTGEYYND
ncbi:MAG: antibiotic biosynthesis monooxygenase family protein [Pseudomonadota bacterium]